MASGFSAVPLVRRPGADPRAGPGDRPHESESRGAVRRGPDRNGAERRWPPAGQWSGARLCRAWGIENVSRPANPAGFPI